MWIVRILLGLLESVFSLGPNHLESGCDATKRFSSSLRQSHQRYIVVFLSFMLPPHTISQVNVCISWSKVIVKTVSTLFLHSSVKGSSRSWKLCSA